MEPHPIPFRLDDQPDFDDIGVTALGHIASDRGIELVAVQGSHTEETPHEMTSMGWLLHSFITPPRGTLRIDSGREMQLPRFSFYPPNVPLRWRSSPCVATVSLFKPEFMTTLMMTDPHFNPETLGCIVTKASQRLAYLSQQAFRETRSPGFGATLFAEAIGMEIALEIIRCDRRRSSESMSIRGGLAPWQLRRLESYVHEHLSDDLSLQHLAQLLGMSVRHLSRVLKREKGVSVHRWIANLRLEEAQRLLAMTSIPVHEVAQRTAFGSLSAFSVAFQASTGMRPSDYRQRTRP